MVSSQSDVSLLGTVWSDQSVNVLNVNLVQLLDGLLDLMLVGLHTDLENQGVTILNLLDSGLSGDRGDDDLVGVQSWGVRNSQGRFRVSAQLQGSWQLEGGVGSDLRQSLGVGTLQCSFLGGRSLSVY